MLLFPFFLAFFVTKITMCLMKDVLSHPATLKENFQGLKIPGTAGIVFPFIWAVCILAPLGTEQEKAGPYLVDLCAFFAVALLGFWDDIVGRYAPKGFRGHFSCLLKEGRVSSGVVKAVGIGIIAGWVVQIRAEKAAFLFLDWLLVVFSVNFVNLLDLRPGRALKAVLPLLLPGIFVTEGQTLSAIGIGTVLAYAPWDLKEQAMLGDAGSNTLGMMAGLVLLESPEKYRMIAAAVLCLINLGAEKYSFSTLIFKSGWLRRLDEWGRENK